MSDQAIPQDVLDTPANPDGDGFIQLDVWSSSMIGSDGLIYTRTNGVIHVDGDAEDT